MPKILVRKPPPHEFVLEALESLSPQTRVMFGTLAIYVGDRIVGALRDKEDYRDDNGMWLATSPENHESLRRELPSMREIRIFTMDRKDKSGPPPSTGWQNLPAESANFEEEALHACELILKGDPRIGKVPKKRKSKTPRGKATPEKVAKKR